MALIPKTRWLMVYTIQVSDEFLGPSYNLLHKNCNHFTSALCCRLTSKPAPNWLNRAANIGIALPCVVPREWVNPPDHETAEGRLLDDEEAHEQSVMLHRRQPVQKEYELADESQTSFDQGHAQPAAIQDTSGIPLPLSEQAPNPDHH